MNGNIDPIRRIHYERSETGYMSYVALFQGFYYMVTGIWPVLHISSFMVVTGPKDELWLVRTIGILIFITGAGIFTAGIRREVTVPVIVIAAGAAVGFIAVDIVYVWLGTISGIYLLDAVAQFILLVIWVVSCLKDAGLNNNVYMKGKAES
jgi:hypothetical protein